MVIASILLLTLMAPAEGAGPPDPVQYRFVVQASPAEVWKAWTTTEGLRSFFAPQAQIELRTFGRFEIHFDPHAAAGARGAEGNVVLAFEPERMLSTTWDAPPKFPAVRAQRTFLQIRLAPAPNGHTEVLLVQDGFGTGHEWRQVRDYFAGAWTWVAASLQHRFEAGPIDWTRPPNLLPRMQAIGGDAALRWAASQK